MHITAIAISTIFLYGAGALLPMFTSSANTTLQRGLLLLLGLIAVCLHGFLLHIWIDTQAGQNLNFFNLFSLATWLVTIIAFVVVFVRAIEMLVLILFPLNILSILLVLLFPRIDVIHTVAHPEILFHILLAVFTFAVLGVAALLAILLAWQENLLRSKRHPALMVKLPPLAVMESLLFQVISLGFVLLTLVLATSFYFYYPLLWHYAFFLQKSVLSVAAWVIFAMLLIGRHLWGWRGRKVIYGTLMAMVLLFLTYFGK